MNGKVQVIGIDASEGNCYLQPLKGGKLFENYDYWIAPTKSVYELDSEFMPLNLIQYISMTVDDYKDFKESYSTIMDEFPTIKKEGVYYFQEIDGKQTNLSEEKWKKTQKDTEGQLIPDNEWKDCSELKSTSTNSITSNPTKTNNNFVGEWNRTNTNTGTAAEITIKNQTLKYFDFCFIGAFGGNVGSIDGTATIIDSNKAVFEYTSETDKEYTVKAQFLLDNNCLKVAIIDGSNSTLGFGNHVVIDGEYTKSEPIYTNANIINEILTTNEIKEKMKTLLGENNYKQVLDVIQDGMRYEYTNLNYSGFLEGCGQGVDLLIKDNKIYCLAYFIGVEGYTLYTNDKNYKDTLPSFFHIDRQDYKLGFVYKP